MKIFCIEGDWEENLSNQTRVVEGLSYLKNVTRINFIHKNCSLKNQFETYLNKALNYKSYNILYIAFHGSKNKLHFDNNEFVTLEMLGNILEGKLENKFLHFGSCQFLNQSPEKIKHFINQTGVKIITGYKKDIDFFRSTTFDLIYFNELNSKQKSVYALKEINKTYESLINKLGFVSYVNP